MVKFFKIWAYFLGANTGSTVCKYVWVGTETITKYVVYKSGVC